MTATKETIAEGKYLALYRIGRHEFITRLNATGVASVIAITEDRKLILLENDRPALGGKLLELPGGMVGDEPGKEEESAEEAAARELLEETGYAPLNLIHLGRGPSSAGQSSEIIDLFLAYPVRKTGEPAEGEEGRLQLVALDALDDYLAEAAARGLHIDYRIHAGLHMARPHLPDALAV